MRSLILAFLSVIFLFPSVCAGECPIKEGYPERGTGFHCSFFSTCV